MEQAASTSAGGRTLNQQECNIIIIERAGRQTLLAFKEGNACCPCFGDVRMPRLSNSQQALNARTRTQNKVLRQRRLSDDLLAVSGQLLECPLVPHSAVHTTSVRQRSRTRCNWRRYCRACDVCLRYELERGCSDAKNF